MIRFLTVCAMLMVLSVLGCSKSEDSKSTQGTAESAAKEEKPVAGAEEPTGMEQQAEQAMEETEEAAVAAAEKAGEMADMAAEEAEEMATEAEKVAEKAVEETKQAVSPETIELEASYGNITFPHGMHSKAYDCSTCHGEGMPGPIGLDKDKAHPLCKGCHEEEGAGPTACKDCHQK